MSSTHLCDTYQLLMNAMRNLQGFPYLFVDFKGFQLGTTEGHLSLISIGTPNAEDIYLFDAAKLSPTELQPFIALLGNKGVTKLVWDGRMGCVELLEMFDVVVFEAVMDMALVDVISRIMRGEGEYERKGRLATRGLPRSQIEGLQTDGVHRLSTLRYACAEHDVGLPLALHDRVTPSRRRPSLSSDSDLSPVSPAAPGQKFNFQEPIASGQSKPDLRTQASADVQMMARLYTAFNEQGYFDNHQHPFKLLCRFLETTQSRVPLDIASEIRSLVPLEVLEDTAVGVAGPRFRCSCCDRILREDSFVFKKMRRRAPCRTDSCKVCHIVNIRKGLKAQRRSYYDEENDFDCDEEEEEGFGDADGGYTS